MLPAYRHLGAPLQDPPAKESERNPARDGAPIPTPTPTHPPTHTHTNTRAHTHPHMHTRTHTCHTSTHTHTHTMPKQQEWLRFLPCCPLIDISALLSKIPQPRRVNASRREMEQVYGLSSSSPGPVASAHFTSACAPNHGVCLSLSPSYSPSPYPSPSLKLPHRARSFSLYISFSV